MNRGARNIARWRLQTQRLTGVPARGPVELVSHLLAVQAENHAQAAWAVATRCAAITEAELGAVFDRGDILRTHVVRPTWHFVLPDDIVWLTEVTAPRIRRATAQNQRDQGIDDATLDASVAAVVAAIDADGPLTRQQLRDRLLDAGLPAAGPALTVVTATAEASALICSGPRHDGEHTHALLAERAPAARRLDRPAALAELALRYITGHGPATDRDLAYWASLTLGDARAGLDAVRDRLSTFVSDDRTYWYERDTEPASLGSGSAHLLQILDEIYRGYQDSRCALDADERLGRGREPSTGMALLDGQVAATMHRRITDTVTFELRPHRPVTSAEEGSLAAVARRYGAFLERPARLVIRS
jgi:hypothetical protein